MWANGRHAYSGSGSGYFLDLKGVRAASALSLNIRPTYRSADSALNNYFLILTGLQTILLCDSWRNLDWTPQGQRPFGPRWSLYQLSTSERKSPEKLQVYCYLACIFHYKMNRGSHRKLCQCKDLPAASEIDLGRGKERLKEWVRFWPNNGAGVSH